MDERLAQIYERLSERYDSGDVPWDDALPPPEVMELLAGLTPGKALDLGCGYGRAAIYMAGLGWQVDAIDFIPEAIEEASRRAILDGVKVQFHLAEVTDLDFLTGPYDFALDVGCAHNLPLPGLMRYEEQLSRLLLPGGHFLLFGRVREPNDEMDTNSSSGFDENKLFSTFSADFELKLAEHGITEVVDQLPWSSAWYHFQRR